MWLRFYGHATIALEVDEQTLLIDPYEPGGFGGLMRYAPITAPVDWVVCSHQHADHCAVAGLKGRARLIEAGRAGPFHITRHTLAHDEYEGRRRGGMVDALVIEAQGLRVVHLSDVGQSPTPELVAALRRPDALVVPVGGYYTIGAAQAWEWARRLDPGCALPVHQRTPWCGLAGIRDDSAWRAHWPGSVLVDSGAIRVEDQRVGQSVMLAPLGGSRTRPPKK